MLDRTTLRSFAGGDIQRIIMLHNLFMDGERGPTINGEWIVVIRGDGIDRVASVDALIIIIKHIKEASSASVTVEEVHPTSYR